MSFPGPDDGETGPLRREIWDSRLSSVDGAVKEFPSRMWDAMSEQAKQEVFKWNNVVIRADSEVRLSGVTGWDDKRLRKVLNFRLLRQAHGKHVVLRRLTVMTTFLSTPDRSFHSPEEKCAPQ